MKNIFKTIIVITLSVAMVLNLTACKKSNKSSQQKIDIDLSALSDTVAYTEIYNMSREPDKYLGKTVKMTGISYKYFDQTTKKSYYECTIYDATACCTQGFEFQLKGNAKYPKDEEKVTVIGKFTKEKGKGYFFVYLKDAVLE